MPRLRLLALLALGLAAPAVARDRPSYNRSADSMHAPIVSRTDLMFDVAMAGGALAPGEPQRLADWFDSLALSYGDTVRVDASGVGGDAAAADGVGAVLSRYGMLLAHSPAPVTAGHPAPGTARVVVSRAIARVEGCPDWARGNWAEYDNANTSNFGCATATNLAAMVADPQDLVQGREAGPASDASLSVKAVAAWREADVTGKKGLEETNTRATLSSGGGK
ncbi:CpaD family pilus assembly lipoprotein [Sphingomonas morindae]|uniref:CpaD family pilus assembly protein n=1 Tax=Sphingomonas morindae TaxID=1541170 RepID=A0ABY4X4W2_9SPHN|nr:CpaD family pilus assembly lipoprotein [Sphingomonas morindae]USI71937.1 CpaD family pilus assembly protein [Sphingomonas morindae]